MFSLTESEDAKRQQRILDLYDLHAPGIYKYLRGLGMGREESEDVLQEAFLRLANHLSDSEGDSNLRSWLYQVAHNLSMDLHRERRRNKAQTDIDDENFVEPIDPGSNPEGIYLQKEAMERVQTALLILTPKQRHGILLRAQGLRYFEIATVLKVSESRAIYLVKQGLKRLTGGM